MELVLGTIKAAAVRTGTETYQLATESQLSIRTKDEHGGWLDQLDYEVPAGKKAVVTVAVRITETEA